MQQYIYLICLLVSIAGITVLDRRFKLVWFWRPKRAAAYIGIGMLFFLAWDIAGIVLDVFATNQAWVTGLYIVTPNLPVEEFLFLYFLNYLALGSWRYACTRMP